ncbi:MAG: hypothetical protein WC373_04590, partial [Smithella sp.]
MKINLKGESVKTKFEDCPGTGCQFLNCKMRKEKSVNKVLGYYETIKPFGAEVKVWRCEYF